MTDAIAQPTPPASDPALEAAAWDLEPLVDGRGSAGVEALLATAIERAEALAQRLRGRVAGQDARGLAEALRELEGIADVAGRAASYAMLSFSLDTADPARGALMQRAHEQGARIETTLLFLELEWNQLDDEHVGQLLRSGELEFCAHYLRTVRRYRPHQLSEPEERVLTETDVTGASAFQRLFTEQVSALEVSLPDAEAPVAFEEALSRLHDPARERRAEAAAAITEALRPGLRG